MILSLLIFGPCTKGLSAQEVIGGLARNCYAHHVYPFVLLAVGATIKPDSAICSLANNG